MTEANYADARPDGEVNHYDEDGKLLRTELWKDGEMVAANKR